MGSCLSISVNIIQILSFVIQLVQAGPDLMSRIPIFVRVVYARSRGMIGEPQTATRVGLELIAFVRGMRDDTRTLEEGRVGAE
jgi:hypothetical protein